MCKSVCGCVQVTRVRASDADAHGGQSDADAHGGQVCVRVRASDADIHGSQRRALESLKLELYVVMS